MNTSSAASEKNTLVNFTNNPTRKNSTLIFQLSLAATFLFCLRFWGDLPDFGMATFIGRSIAIFGLLILASIITFRFKWPVILGLVGMGILLSISWIQQNPNAEIVEMEKEKSTHTSYMHMQP